MFKCNFLYFTFQPFPLALFSCTSNLWKDLPPYFLLLSKFYKKLDKLPLSLLFPRLNSSSSKPPLVWQVLQALIHTHGPSLDLLQYGLLSLGPWNPGLCIALQMYPQQWRRMTRPDSCFKIISQIQESLCSCTSHHNHFLSLMLEREFSPTNFPRKSPAYAPVLSCNKPFSTSPHQDSLTFPSYLLWKAILWMPMWKSVCYIPTSPLHQLHPSVSVDTEKL